MKKHEIEKSDFDRLCETVIQKLKNDDEKNKKNKLSELISKNSLTETLKQDNKFIEQLKELYKKELLIAPSDYKIHNTLYVIECILREEYINNKKLSPDQLDEISGGTFDSTDPSLIISLEFLSQKF